MPYISKEEAVDLRNRLSKTTPGQLNYLYTVEFVRMWKANPSYSTFHLISKSVIRPETDEGVLKLTTDLKPFVKQTDLEVARTEALAEFRRRVMVRYENHKLGQAENIDPYLVLEAKPEAKSVKPEAPNGRV